MPGEVSLVHHDMLFLDERPRFRRHVLDVSRQPLEEDVSGVIGRIPSTAFAALAKRCHAIRT